MIRWAVPADFAAIRRLWETCFPDSSGFNAYYFQSLFRLENTALLLQEETLCAMVQMLPYRMSADGREGEATYIYGACTDPAMRKQGHMAQLLDWTFQLDQAHGRIASVLIPQEEWLFAFYAKFGYQPVFTVEDTMYHIASPSFVTALRPCTPQDIAMLDALYQKQAAPQGCYLRRTADDWLTQIQMFQSLGAGAYGLIEEGQYIAYAFVWETEDGFWAQELVALHQRAFSKMCDALCESLQVQSLRVTTIGTKTPLGCAKFYDPKHAARTGYMNLLLN